LGPEEGRETKEGKKNNIGEGGGKSEVIQREREEGRAWFTASECRTRRVLRPEKKMGGTKLKKKRDESFPSSVRFMLGPGKNWGEPLWRVH